MELEIIIVKTYHKNLRDFEFSRQFIDDCDVISIENAAASDHANRIMERDIMNVQKGVIRRDDFIKNVPDYDEYISALYDFIFEKKKIVVSAERFYGAESYQIQDIKEKVNDCEQISFPFRHSIEEFGVNVWEHFKQWNDYVSRRDKNIADNISSKVPQRMREFGIDMNKVRYVVLIGEQHSPEIYVPCKSVEIISPNIEFESRPLRGLLKAQKIGASFGECKHFIAAEYLLSMVENYLVGPENPHESYVIVKDLEHIQVTEVELNNIAKILLEEPFDRITDKKQANLARLLMNHGVNVICGIDITAKVNGK